MLKFIKRYGFHGLQNNQKYVGYLYKDTISDREFSIAFALNNDSVMYINEIDESFSPTDNTFSTLTSSDLENAKKIIRDLLNSNVGNVKENK